MRKTLTALLLAAALPTLAIAAPGPDDMGPHHGRGDGYHDSHGIRGMDLSTEQRQLIRSQMREQAKNRHEIIQRYLDKLPAAEKAAMHKELQANRDKTDKAIRDQLTPEQRKQYDEMQKEREARRAERAEFEAWKAERDKKAQ